MCVKVVVELQILKSGRARDVHASTVSPYDIALISALTSIIKMDDF